MKNIFIFLITCLTYSCSSSIKSSSKGDIESIAIHKQADINSVKNLISNSFQHIWSDLDSTAILRYYTTDFALLENGVVWNTDSIANYIMKRQSKGQDYKRLNRFDFLKSVHNQNTIWIAYDNYATWKKGSDTLRKAHWLESVIAIKENNLWKLQQLHSTVVRK